MLEGEIETMKKKDVARDKTMAALVKKLAAFTVNQPKQGSKAAVDDKG